MANAVVATVPHGEGPGISIVSKNGLRELIEASPLMHPERPNDEADCIYRTMLGFIRLFIDDPEDARVHILDRVSISVYRSAVAVYSCRNPTTSGWPPCTSALDE